MHNETKLDLDDMTREQRLEMDVLMSKPGAILEVPTGVDIGALDVPFPSSTRCGYVYPPSHRRLTLTIDVYDSGDDLLQPYIEQAISVWLARSKISEVWNVEERIPPRDFNCIPEVKIVLAVAHEDLTLRPENGNGQREGREAGQRTQRGAHEEEGKVQGQG